VECLVGGASKIIYHGVETTLNWCDGKTDLKSRFRVYGQPPTDKTRLKEFAGAVSTFLERKEEIQIRVEGSHFNLFCKDTDIFNSIVSKLNNWINNIYEPSSQEELEFLLDNNNKRILCDKLPYEKYTYKVVMKGAGTNISDQFYNWSKNYGEDKIKISPQTIKWMTGYYYYKQDPFFYVADGPMLTMARLFLGDRVRKVYEYVPRDTLEKG
jgi:hypothetical protein